ncbi:MAG: sugar transferase [Chitinophagaceae bacterium]
MNQLGQNNLIQPSTATYRASSVNYRQTSNNGIPYKRVFDVVVSFLVIVFILSWLIPLLAILIKLDSKGPVFFIQKRIGGMSKIFNCLKLRTMVVNEIANSCQAQENDPRITLFGKLLRRTCLDELPQFFNVLIGEMSIVGPRPHMIKDCEDFIKVVPSYELRHAVKPGITGMAQVKGYRGQTNSFYDVFHRYQWDIFYVRNACFALDMKIIYKTLVQILSSFTKTAKTPVTGQPVSPERHPLVDSCRDQFVKA